MAKSAESADLSDILIAGPWQHRFIAANGARFHVAELGTGPMVMLLHGFPLFWWTWRQQMVALADAGYRVVAMDLRGYGASDKPPKGYTPATLTADVTGVIQALGESQAVIVGHDWGAWVAWAMPILHPTTTRAIGVIGMGHPLVTRRCLAGQSQLQTAAMVARYQVPWLPDRRLRTGGVGEALHRGWGTGAGPDTEVIRTYQHAMRLPFVAQTSLEYYRRGLRSWGRRDHRRFVARLEQPVSVPVLQIHGAVDSVVRPEVVRTSGQRCIGPTETVLLDGVGHFATEEAPDAVTGALKEWLAQHA